MGAIKPQKVNLFLEFGTKEKKLFSGDNKNYIVLTQEVGGDLIYIQIGNEKNLQISIYNELLGFSENKNNQNNKNVLKKRKTHKKKKIINDNRHCLFSFELHYTHLLYS